MPVIRIPPLVSGGIMLTYRCTNTCRHCLYRCSPRQPDEWMSADTAGRVMTALAREPRLTGIHLAGGESTLRTSVLLDVLRRAGALGVPVDYLETNAFWCRDRGETTARFEDLRRAGLAGVLISVSLFHNEFVPLRNTRTAIAAARDVFGPDGVTLWLPQMLGLLERLGDDGTHPLEVSCERLGLRPDDPLVAEMYGVIMGGRAAAALRGCYAPRPAAAYAGQTCRAGLTRTTHFHIDPYGHLFTGLCAGLVAASVDDLHPAHTEQSRPVFVRLCTEGAYGLAEWAVREAGFAYRPEGYVSRCDLCLDVRGHLHRGGRFPELAPAGFYEYP